MSLSPVIHFDAATARIKANELADIAADAAGYEVTVIGPIGCGKFHALIEALPDAWQLIGSHLTNQTDFALFRADLKTMIASRRPVILDGVVGTPVINEFFDEFVENGGVLIRVETRPTTY